MPDNEVRYHAAIIRVHAWAISVEYPCDFDAQFMLPIIVEEEGFGAALTFIIARTRSDRIDVAPIVFALWVDRGSP